jgi:hypothetical protein
MVGVAGFEPATTRTPSVCATRLRYTPTARKSGAKTEIIIALAAKLQANPPSLGPLAAHSFTKIHARRFVPHQDACGSLLTAMRSWL